MSYSLNSTLSEPTGSSRQAAFSDDYLAVASGDNNTYLYDAATLSELSASPLTDASDTVDGVHFSPDGSLLATASHDNNVYVYDTSDWSLIQTLTQASDLVRDVRFGDNGSLLAYPSNDNSVYVHDTSDWSLTKTLTESSGDVLEVDLSSSYIAYGGFDAAVYVHDISDWSLTQTLSFDENVLAVRFSNDGAWLAASDVRGSLSGGNIDVFDTSDWSTVQAFDTDRTHDGLEFSPIDRRLAVGSHDDSTYVFDTSDWSQLANLTEPGNNVIGVAWSRDAKWLASASTDGSTYIYDSDVRYASIATQAATGTPVTASPTTTSTGGTVAPASATQSPAASSDAQATGGTVTAATAPQSPASTSDAQATGGGVTSASTSVRELDTVLAYTFVTQIPSTEASASPLDAHTSGLAVTDGSKVTTVQASPIQAGDETIQSVAVTPTQATGTPQQAAPSATVTADAAVTHATTRSLDAAGAGLVLTSPGVVTTVAASTARAEPQPPFRYSETGRNQRVPVGSTALQRVLQTHAMNSHEVQNPRNTTEKAEMTDFHLKRHDTRPTIQDQLQDSDGNAVDLSSVNEVRFLMQDLDETSIVDDATNTSIDDAANGKVSYSWQSGDTDQEGSFEAEWQVTYSSGEVESFPNDGYIDITITADINDQ